MPLIKLVEKYFIVFSILILCSIVLASCSNSSVSKPQLPPPGMGYVLKGYSAAAWIQLSYASANSNNVTGIIVYNEGPGFTSNCKIQSNTYYLTGSISDGALRINLISLIDSSLYAYKSSGNGKMQNGNLIFDKQLLNPVSVSTYLNYLAQKHKIWQEEEIQWANTVCKAKEQK